MRLANKIALVTGATGDIGAATALRFAEEGAHVLTTDIKPPPDGYLAALGSHRWFRQADLTVETEVAQLFADIEAEFGRLDVLVNIAGGDLGSNAALAAVDSDNLQRNLDVNLKSTFMCCREAARIMQAQEAGAIVNMCSMTFRGSSANQFAYSAAKGAVYALTRTLAMSLGGHGIRVNAVAPGMIEVHTIISQLPPGVWPQVSKSVGATYPLGRVGQPVEVANCMLFLASDEASFVTGEVLEVSGGGRL